MARIDTAQDSSQRRLTADNPAPPAVVHRPQNSSVGRDDELAALLSLAQGRARGYVID